MFTLILTSICESTMDDSSDAPSASKQTRLDSFTCSAACSQAPCISLRIFHSHQQI